jgi:hypothetical protein
MGAEAQGSEVCSFTSVASLGVHLVDVGTELGIFVCRQVGGVVLRACVSGRALWSRSSVNDGYHTYTYDNENRLTQVDGEATASYLYSKSLQEDDT